MSQPTPDLLDPPQEQSTPDPSGISLVRCNNERDLLRYPIDEIAHSIAGHEVPRTFPIYLVFYHGILRGWLQVVQQVVVYPTLDPNIIGARDLVKLTRSLVTEFKRLMGDPIYMFCEVAEQLGPAKMRRFRLKKSKEVAYVYDSEAP